MKTCFPRTSRKKLSLGAASRILAVALHLPLLWAQSDLPPYPAHAGVNQVGVFLYYGSFTDLYSLQGGYLGRVNLPGAHTLVGAPEDFKVYGPEKSFRFVDFENIEQFNSTVRDFQIVNGVEITLPIMMGEGTYPTSYRTRDGSLFRYTEKQLEYSAQFKIVYWVYTGGTYMGVSQVEPFVYLVKDFEGPLFDAKIDDYVRLKRWRLRPPGYTAIYSFKEFRPNPNSALHRYAQWLKTWSFIMGFHHIEDRGYYVIYWRPDIQKNALVKSFAIRPDLQEWETLELFDGTPAGIHEGRLYWWDDGVQSVAVD